MLFGIPDPWVWGAYLLCVLSVVLCVLWGLLRWNREDPPPAERPGLEEEMKRRADRVGKVEGKL